MKKWWTVATLLLSAGLANAAVAETRSFDLTGFDALSVSEGIDAILTRDAGFQIEAESRDSDDLDRLELEVRNGRLVLGIEDRRWRWFENGRSSMTVRITLPTLTAVRASSGASLSADIIAGDTLEIIATSGASIEIERLEGGDVETAASSGAQIDIGSGICIALDADSSSGAMLSMSGVVCADAVVSASSGAVAEVHTTDGLDASAASGGQVRILGSPSTVREINVSSGGDIDFR